MILGTSALLKMNCEGSAVYFSDTTGFFNLLPASSMNLTV